MKSGGFLHNHVLLDPLETIIVQARGRSVREYQVQMESKTGYIDLFGIFGNHRIAIEAERTPDRVINDLHKAQSAKAETLLIVTPTAPVARSARRRLVRCARAGPETIQIFIRPLGPAKTALTNQIRLFFACL